MKKSTLASHWYHNRYVYITLIGIVVYVLLANARSVKTNPFLDGGNIAVQMIVPVFIGFIAGKYAGLSTGIFGTLLSSLTKLGMSDFSYEILSVIPHGVMGYIAGSMPREIHYTCIPLTIGHILNILTYQVFGLDIYYSVALFLGLSYEIFVGTISIIIIYFIYKLGFDNGTYYK